MPDLSDAPRPSQLWKQMSPERRSQAAEAFWRDENGVAEHAEAIAAIAQRIKFRPRSVAALSTEKKTRYLVGLSAVSEVVAARLLVAYHMVHQRPMMGAFLDALGIRHDEGVIADEDLAPPDPAALSKGASSLAAAYPPEDVALYLSTLIWQDPDAWGALAKTPEARSGATV